MALAASRLVPANGGHREISSDLKFIGSGLWWWRTRFNHDTHDQLLSGIRSRAACGPAHAGRPLGLSRGLPLSSWAWERRLPIPPRLSGARALSVAFARSFLAASSADLRHSVKTLLIS